MKIILLMTMLITLLSASEPSADTYDTSYCHGEEEQVWNNIIKNDPYNMSVQELHAIWLGLCIKVEKHQLTTNQAEDIFHKAKNKVIEQERLIAKKSTIEL